MSSGEGLVQIIAGGILAGLFTTPLRLMPLWRWENAWLVYSVFGMFIFPWMLVGATVPNLGATYEGIASSTWVEVALFGAGWGAGSVFFGLGTDAVGNSLGFSIILGLTSTLGSLVPLLVFHSDEVKTASGVYNLVSLGITLVGLGLLGYAGSLKEAEQSKKHVSHEEDALDAERSLLRTEGSLDSTAQSSKPKLPFPVGLTICLLSGVLSSMLNVSLTFGNPIKENAEAAGASSANANNAVWVIGVGAGALVNLAYTVYLLFRNRTWGLFAGATVAAPGSVNGDVGGREAVGDDGAAWYFATLRGPRALLAWFYCAVMGSLWFFGTALYGIGASNMGALGTTIGWPIYITVMILTGNVSGVLLGEWKGSELRSRLWMGAGIALLIVAIIVNAVGSGKD